MTKGFITVATGRKQYYKLAYNLLRSYRHFSANPYPFAIIAEEENEYTKYFDRVIITGKAQHNFMDKLLVFENLPFDENIFLDSDSLAFGDLNYLWEIFKNATDFSSFGNNYDLYNNDNLTWWDDCWYDLDGIGKYGEGVSYRARCHAGVCFFRNTNNTKKMYEDCLEIIQNYNSLIIKSHPMSMDEASLAIAGAKNHMRFIKEPFDKFGIIHSVKNIVPDIVHNKFAYDMPWGERTENCILMHFGTENTTKPVYRFSMECIDYLIKYKNKKPSLIKKLLFHKRWRYNYLNLPYKNSFVNKVLVKLRLKKFF